MHTVHAIPDSGVNPLWSEVQALTAERNRLAEEKVELLSELMTAWRDAEDQRVLAAEWKAIAQRREACRVSA